MSKSQRPDGSKIEDWIEPLTKRGRWGRVSSADKGMVDRTLVDELSPAFLAEFGIELRNACEGSDPPDIVVRVDGREVSVELVELLKEDVRKQRACSMPVSLESQLWSECEFVAKLNQCLDKKDAKYAKRSDGFVADILLIHSCEPWLNAADVGQWLSRAAFTPRRSMRSVYFTQERLPDYPKSHWPLFRLYS